MAPKIVKLLRKSKSLQTDVLQLTKISTGILQHSRSVDSSMPYGNSKETKLLPMLFISQESKESNCEKLVKMPSFQCFCHEIQISSIKQRCSSTLVLLFKNSYSDSLGGLFQESLSSKGKLISKCSFGVYFSKKIGQNLNQGGQIMPTKQYLQPRIFRPSDGPDLHRRARWQTRPRRPRFTLFWRKIQILRLTQDCRYWSWSELALTLWCYVSGIPVL